MVWFLLVVSLAVGCGDDKPPATRDAGTSVAGQGAGAGGLGAQAGQGGTSAQAGTGGAGGAAGAAGGSGASATVEQCAPGTTSTWSVRKNCESNEIAALQAAGLGPSKAYQYGVYSQALATPMVAGSPYTYSLAVGSLHGMPVNVELWGATEHCAGEVELLAAQTVGADTGFQGVVCATVQPTKPYAHLLTVIRSDDGFSHSTQSVCPDGTCSGTNGTSGEWPGKTQPFCDPHDPEHCEACADLATCDAPTYTDHGNGTVTSSCCGLSWQQVASDTAYDFAGAQAYCSSLTLAGGGWRLPALAELLTLVDTSFDPALDPLAFPGAKGSGIWSSTDYRSFGEIAGVSFSSGVVGGTDPDRTMYVRCVR